MLKTTSIYCYGLKGFRVKLLTYVGLCDCPLTPIPTCTYIM